MKLDCPVYKKIRGLMIIYILVCLGNMAINLQINGLDYMFYVKPGCLLMISPIHTQSQYFEEVFLNKTFKRI